MVGFEDDSSKGRGLRVSNNLQTVGRLGSCAETEVRRTSGTWDPVLLEVICEIAGACVFRELVAAVDPFCRPVCSECASDLGDRSQIACVHV